MTNSIKNYITKNPTIVIFTLVFILFLTLGFYISYSNDLVTNTKYDLIYSYDSGKYFEQYYTNHFLQNPKAIAHPLFRVFFNPIICFFEGILSSQRLNSIVFPAFIQTITTVLLFLTMITSGVKRNISFLFTGIFVFSLTTLLSASIAETYVFSSFAQILLLFFTINLSKQNHLNHLSFKNIFIISFLVVLSFGINFSNLLLSIVPVVYLVQKIDKDKVKNYIKIFIITGLMITAFTVFQKFAYNQKVFINEIHTNSGKISTPLNHNFKTKFSKQKLDYLVNGTYIAPFYATRCGSTYNKKLNRKIWKFHKHQNNLIFYLPILILFSVPFIYKKKYNNDFIYPLIAIVTLQTIFNYVFCTTDCFIYAPNYFAALIILLSIMYTKVIEKFAYCILSLFIIFQVVTNYLNIHSIVKFISENNLPNPFLCFSYAICIALSFVLLYKIFKKFINKEFSSTDYCNSAILFYIAYIFSFGIYIVLGGVK